MVSTFLASEESCGVLGALFVAYVGVGVGELGIAGSLDIGIMTDC